MSSGGRKIWFFEIKNDGFDPEKVSGGGRIGAEDYNLAAGRYKPQIVERNPEENRIVEGLDKLLKDLE